MAKLRHIALIVPDPDKAAQLFDHSSLSNPGQLSDLAGQRHIDRVFEPLLGADERETRYAAWQQAVERARL